MKTLRTSILLVAVIVIAAGCATSGAANKDVFRGPVRIEQGPSNPQLEIPESVRDVRPGWTNFEIMVDSLGNPEPDSFKISGTASNSDRIAIQQWLLASRFHPATRNGHPVAAVFKMKYETKIQVRRN